LLNDFDLFGSSVAAAGDIDGDQIPDLLVGAPGDDDGGAETGSVYLVFLNSDGSAREVRKFSNGANAFLRLLDPGDRFGAAVVGPGDMDGDGIADLIVGAPGDDDGDDKDTGAIWILFLDEEAKVRKVAKISDKVGELDTNLRSKIGFGSSLASIGRLDTDLIPEIVVGAPFDDSGPGSDVGALFVLWLNPDGTVRKFSKISSADGGLGSGLGRGVNFGTSVTPIGDINGDRVVDLLVGAPKDDDGKGDNLGAAWVVMLSREGTVVARQKISDTEGRLRARLSAGDRFGHGVAALGDVNGDGVVDVLVGAPGDDGSGYNAGAAWVVNLDGVPEVCADANETGTVQGEDALVVLRVVVGLAQCELCRCDTDGDGEISPADALAVIRAAIELPVTLNCPRCELPESVLARDTIQ
jgi:hypothetical protein